MMKAGCFSLKPDDTTTTVRARFASVAEVRSFFAERYHGMAPDEINIRRTCENHGIEYVPPDKGGACWDLWGGTVELRECEA